jgi:hypothetical protein
MVVDLGEVEIMENITMDQRLQLKSALLDSGLELMDDKKSMLIEKLKKYNHSNGSSLDRKYKINFSDYLSQQLNHDYTYLQLIFRSSRYYNEQFIISHKTERIKELIIYGELNITEIAWKMNYSSVAHLSSQFKSYWIISITF